MQHLIQTPLEDELISSAWMRSGQLACLTRPRIISVLRRPGYPASDPYYFFGLGGLDTFCQSTSLSPMQAIIGHSVLPYATSRCSQELANRRLFECSRRSANLGALLLQLVTAIPAKRWCPQCVEVDIKKHGFSYWRRSHNLPGALVCLKHKCSLLASPDQSPRQADKSSWLLPHQVADGHPLISYVTPFSKQLTDAVVRRLMCPDRERLERSTDWLLEKLRKHFVSSDRGRRARVGQILIELLNGTDETCFGSTPDSIVQDITLQLSKRALDKLNPLRFFVIQAAMELPSKHLPVERESDYAQRHRELTCIAENFVSARIRDGMLTSPFEVWAACGISPGNVNRYRSIQDQIDRLRGASCFRWRRSTLQVREQRAAIARKFVSERIQSRVPTNSIDVWNACGFKSPHPHTHPLIEAEVERLRSSTTVTQARSDSLQRHRDLAAIAKAFVDKRIGNGTAAYTTALEVWQACGFTDYNARRRPLIQTEVLRLMRAARAQKL